MTKKKAPSKPKRKSLSVSGSKKSADQFKEAFEAFGKIEQRLSSTNPLAFGLPSLDDLCAQYNDIKGYIKTALEFVDWLPDGPKIHKVIDFLMKLADKYCASRVQAMDVRASQDPFKSIDDVLSRRVAEVQSLRGVGIAACNQYHAMKKYMEPMLEIVEWLPYGPTIVKVARLLIRLADAIC